MHRTFGDIVKRHRSEKGWTIKEFIDRLKADSRTTVSPAFITRVEQYGEIPGPELICRMAEVLELDLKKLLETARRVKVEKFDRGLEKKYQEAAGLYRKGKRKD
jgi:transcriptional regulator with XRE-family HTH domain